MTQAIQPGSGLRSRRTGRSAGGRGGRGTGAWGRAGGGGPLTAGRSAVSVRHFSSSIACTSSRTASC